ncbi:MAG: RsmD family RNA methyltransferase, partial [Firmicutes bacterium]|nr:RsmD family RNA methyltransferase [Bacillota bacterium]
MRVISGSARGLKLKAPKGSSTRPTADRIKESLFNIIAGELYDINFLDLFGGSGAIGIEPVSRGAAKVVVIDSDRDAQGVIKDNIKAA